MTADRIIVFDFDKTLTYRDTLLGFYLGVSPVWRRLPALPVYVVFMVLHKLRWIDNDRLKIAGIRLFLAGLKREPVCALATRYAQGIRLNQVYRGHFLKHRYSLVVSAGFKEYLSALFPEENIIAAELLCNKNGIITGLKQNCYGAQKVTRLKEKGITEIDTFYTDSYSDKPCMEIAKTVYLVKGDAITLIKTNAHSFVRH